MTEIIFASHGNYARGIYDTLKYFTGDMAHLHYLTLGDDSVDIYRSKAETLLAQCPGEILVMVDLFQGTPFKIFYSALRGRSDCQIVANVAFTDALAAIIARDSPLDGILTAIRSNTGLKLVSLNQKTSVQDEEDE